MTVQTIFKVSPVIPLAVVNRVSANKVPPEMAVHRQPLTNAVNVPVAVKVLVIVLAEVPEPGVPVTTVPAALVKPNVESSEGQVVSVNAGVPVSVVTPMNFGVADVAEPHIWVWT